MKRRILFITDNLNQQKIYPPFWALSLSYLAKSRGHSTTIYDMAFNRYTNEDLSEYLKQNEFDIICTSPVSARFVRLSIPQAEVINKYKKNALFVIGGSAVSADTKYHREQLNADIAIKGDIFAKRVKEPIGFDYDLVDMKAYSERLDGYIALIASTGCVSNCNFCFRVTEGYHVRSLKIVVEEMKMLSDRCDSNKFEFLDNMFVTKKNLKAFKKHLDNWKIKFICEARADCVNKEVAKLLKELGCTFVNIGYESMSDAVLHEIGKGVTAKQNEECASILMTEKIDQGVNIITNFKCSDIESLTKSADFIGRFNTTQPRTIKPVTMFPGTRGFIDLGRTCEDFYNNFETADLLTYKDDSFMNTDTFYKRLLNVNNMLLGWWVTRGIITRKNQRDWVQTLHDLYNGEIIGHKFHGFTKNNTYEYKKEIEE